jgi:hypothetical protein
MDGHRSIRIFGAFGVMHNDEIKMTEPTSKKTDTIPVVQTETPSGHLASISANIPKVGRLAWQNPYEAYPFCEEQIGVASVLDGMHRSVREGAPPPYSAQDFLTDIEIEQAFRYSGLRDGASVSLPLSEWQQKAHLMTNPRFVKQLLTK